MDLETLIKFFGTQNAIFIYGCICGFLFRMYIEFKSQKKEFSQTLGLPCIYVSTGRIQYFHRYICANKEIIHCKNLTGGSFLKKNICTKINKKCPYCKGLF